MNNQRLNKLCGGLSENSIDGLLITYPANVTYLCQYKISDSCLLVSAEENFLITDFRYLEEARRNIKGFTVKEAGADISLFELIASMAKAAGLKRLGFEARNLAFAEYEKIKEALGDAAELIPVYDAVEQLRMIKDKDEIAKIKTAVKITQEAFHFLKDAIKPGIKELDVSAELNRFIRLKGAGSSAFDIIVAGGVNSSFPHHQTGLNTINNNTPVLVDMGVDLDGYKSDLTHVFFLGKMPDAVKKAQDVILAAKAKAIALLRPGEIISNIDKTAREYISKFGWGENFGHSTGHGVGLEVHEDPHISRRDNSRLAAGMVFTIEPAVYFPQEFGIRLEDMVLITPEGAEVLNGTLHN